MDFVIHLLQAFCFLVLFLAWLASRVCPDPEARPEVEAVAPAPTDAGVDGAAVVADRGEGPRAVSVEDLAGAGLGAGDHGHVGGILFVEAEEECLDDGGAGFERAGHRDAGGADGGGLPVDGAVGEDESDAADCDGDTADVDDFDGDNRMAVAGVDEAADAKPRAAVEEVAQREGRAQGKTRDGAEGDGPFQEEGLDGSEKGGDGFHAGESSTGTDKLSAAAKGAE